jgi:hypothetical protein
VLIEYMRGGAATMVPLTLAILLGLGLIVMLARVTEPVERRGTVNGTLYAMLATIVIMSVTRHQLRGIYLDSFGSSEALATAPQWGNFALFALLLVAGLATVAYMVRLVLTSPASADDSA